MNRTFLLKMMSLTFIGLLILFNSCESSKKVFNEQKTFDPSGKPLSFKGLRLGMTRAEILESGNDNNFNWTLSDDNILKYNKSDAWIGYEGEEEDKIYYYFHKYVGVTWFEDKIMEFGIKTPIVNSETENDEIKIYYPYAGYYINNYLRKWLRFAQESLSKKYGNPSKVWINWNELDKDSFRSDFNQFIVKWTNENERIAIATSCNFKHDVLRETYWLTIYFTDLNAERKMKEKIRKNPKSEF